MSIGQLKYMGINGMSEHGTHTITWVLRKRERKEGKKCVCVCLFVWAVNKIGNMFILWEVLRTHKRMKTDTHVNTTRPLAIITHWNMDQTFCFSGIHIMIAAATVAAAVDIVAIVVVWTARIIPIFFHFCVRECVFRFLFTIIERVTTHLSYNIKIEWHWFSVRSRWPEVYM